MIVSSVLSWLLNRCFTWGFGRDTSRIRPCIMNYYNRPESETGNNNFGLWMQKDWEQKANAESAFKPCYMHCASVSIIHLKDGPVSSCRERSNGRHTSTFYFAWNARLERVYPPEWWGFVISARRFPHNHNTWETLTVSTTGRTIFGFSFNHFYDDWNLSNV